MFFGENAGCIFAEMGLVLVLQHPVPAVCAST